MRKKILNVRYQKSVAKTVRLKAIEMVRLSKKMHLEILRKFEALILLQYLWPSDALPS